MARNGCADIEFYLLYTYTMIYDILHAIQKAGVFALKGKIPEDIDHT